MVVKVYILLYRCLVAGSRQCVEINLFLAGIAIFVAVNSALTSCLLLEGCNRQNIVFVAHNKC